MAETVGGVLVDGVSAGTPLLVGEVTAIAGAAVLVILRRQRRPLTVAP